jgi:hypothetical protein
MVQIVYVSAAANPFTVAELNTLLARARDRNSVYQVTGMLLYHNGSFLQVLEGAESSVDLIYASIERDKRHRNAKVLHRQLMPRREFPDWSMGFIDTSVWVESARGKFDYQREVPRLAAGITPAQRYLRLFHQGLVRQGTGA